MPHEIQPDGRVHGVVFGCRRDDGRWLMIRRSQHVALPNKVCFPGGGMLVGESQQLACVREAMEELGVRVTPVRHVWSHEFADRSITLYGWLATLETRDFRPEAQEIAEILWLSRAEALAHPDGLPTNRPFIDALERALPHPHR
jgi:8-oxo-dGTP diphosphatase